jgi:hypothetical protein
MYITAGNLVEETTHLMAARKESEEGANVPTLPSRVLPK